MPNFKLIQNPPINIDWGEAKSMCHDSTHQLILAIADTLKQKPEFSDFSRSALVAVVSSEIVQAAMKTRLTYYLNGDKE